jgi:adenosine deaminase
VGLDVLGIIPTGDPEPMPDELVAIIASLRGVLPDLTIHAGEFSGHQSVDRTLELSPRGIGHGVHSLQSPQTLERLAKEGVTLEVCPTSNHLLIPTALAKLEAAHGGQTPLRALQGHVHCVLGSDDPTPMGTCFSRELEVAREKGVDLARLEADMMRRWAELT